MTDELDNYNNQIALARTEIRNLRQQLCALKHEHHKEIKFIKARLSELRCANCGDEATSISSPQVSQPSSDPNMLAYKPIGVIESPFQNKRGVPRQPSVMAKARGVLVIDTSVFSNPEHALSGLEEFSHMWIIFHFHVTESTSTPAKVAPPRLGGERRGVFSTRSPHRPCSIGLSLVKIHSIEENKIHFQGVDMVSGSPVLDIKPYIPQYDYPAAFTDTTMSSLERPPTEGISDAAESMAALQVGDDNFDARSVSPRVVNSIGIDTTSPIPPTYNNDTPQQGVPQSNTLSPSPGSQSNSLPDGTFQRVASMQRPNIERGAPDGQERFTPPQSALMNQTHDGIRVAPWISNPPTQTYRVRFTDDALERLNELIGDRAQMFKSNIECLLSEDPRSYYVKSRYPDHEYSCVLEDLSISCIFDANSSVCTIIAVRNAEELQQT